MEAVGSAYSDARFDVISTNSSNLSSPQGSPTLPTSALLPSHHSETGVSAGIPNHPTSNPMDTTATSPRSIINVASLMNEAPARKKPGLKKKEPNPDAVAAKLAGPKIKVTRKPRPPKDPNAPPVQRKRKAAGDAAPTPPPMIPPPIPQPDAQAIIPTHPTSTIPRSHKIMDLVSPTLSQPRVTSPSTMMRDPPTPNPRPASSGRMFDPIRGATIEKPPVSPTPPPPPPILNRASASPAITSLMNPITASEPARMSHMSQTTTARHSGGASISSMLSDPSGSASVPIKSSVPTKSIKDAIVPSAKAKDATVSKTKAKDAIAPTAKAKDATAPTTKAKDATVPTTKTKDAIVPTTKTKKAVNGMSTPSSTAASIKPKITREAPPLPTGSGLLGGTPFGLTVAPNGESTVPAGTDIWLKFDIKGKENVTINFAHEVEKKYGFAALHPRLAARKERQRQLALAGAALEKELGGEDADEMSLDVSEPESNNDTDGLAKEGTDGEPAKKKRKKRTEEYDRNDDFIDDEELLLEEGALMTRDGFFVYSGPLIQEGERPAVEKYVFLCFVDLKPILTFMQSRWHYSSRSRWSWQRSSSSWWYRQWRNNQSWPWRSRR